MALAFRHTVVRLDRRRPFLCPIVQQLTQLFQNALHQHRGTRRDVAAAIPSLEPDDESSGHPSTAAEPTEDVAELADGRDAEMRENEAEGEMISNVELEARVGLITSGGGDRFRANLPICTPAVLTSGAFRFHATVLDSHYPYVTQLLVGNNYSEMSAKDPESLANVLLRYPKHALTRDEDVATAPPMKEGKTRSLENGTAEGEFRTLPNSRYTYVVSHSGRRVIFPIEIQQDGRGLVKEYKEDECTVKYRKETADICFPNAPFDLRLALSTERRLSGMVRSKLLAHHRKAVDRYICWRQRFETVGEDGMFSLILSQELSLMGFREGNLIPSFHFSRLNKLGHRRVEVEVNMAAVAKAVEGKDAAEEEQRLTEIAARFWAIWYPNIQHSAMPAAR